MRTIYEVTIYDEVTGRIIDATTKSTYEDALAYAGDRKGTIQSVQILGS